MRRYYSNDNLAHPMSGYGFSFSDIINPVLEQGQELIDSVTSGDLLRRELQRRVAGATQEIAMNPAVQRELAEEAEKKLLEQSILSLQAERQAITADIAELTKNPLKFAKANPMKAALYIGAPVAVVAWLVLRK